MDELMEKVQAAQHQLLLDFQLLSFFSFYLFFLFFFDLK